MITLVSAGGRAGLMEWLRWVDDFSRRTGRTSPDALAGWIESHERPLVFIGAGITLARLVVRFDETGLAAVVAVRGQEIITAPLALLPFIPVG